MSDLVQLTKENSIAIITINNPPVNALSPGVPEGISAAMDEVDRDDSIKAAVLIGGVRAFLGGGPITKLGTSRSVAAPRGQGLVPRLLRVYEFPAALHL